MAVRGFVGRVLIGRRIFWTLAFHRAELDRKLASVPFSPGRVLVVGSAPDSKPPAGIDATWSIVTTNASQVRLDDWNLPGPDLTVFRGDILDDTKEHQRGVWRVLSGRSTKHLIAIAASPRDAALAEELSKRNYTARTLTILTNIERRALIHELYPLVSPKLLRGDIASQGILAVLLSLRFGASAVVLSGFSFSSDGHVYATGAAPVPRRHIEVDREALRILLKRRAPVFAAEEKFARESGLPLWTGDDVGHKTP